MEVFISVHQFKKSVMVSVATGGGTGETVPMLIRRYRSLAIRWVEIACSGLVTSPCLACWYHT
ncbi:unnamed protein product [Effrenium voratum]|uniref:Uncharacterized protein n=1 Tax=Effrenium voratum TaxID=2562239 RepID=A0AA36I9U1_9DINO|nr:unnamed protein product [Effrenium voratum]